MNKLVEFQLHSYNLFMGNFFYQANTLRTHTYIQGDSNPRPFGWKGSILLTELRFVVIYGLINLEYKYFCQILILCTDFQFFLKTKILLFLQFFDDSIEVNVEIEFLHGHIVCRRILFKLLFCLEYINFRALN